MKIKIDINQNYLAFLTRNDTEGCKHVCNLSISIGHLSFTHHYVDGARHQVSESVCDEDPQLHRIVMEFVSHLYGHVYHGTFTLEGR